MRLPSRLLVLVSVFVCSLAARPSPADTLRGLDGADGESFDLILSAPLPYSRIWLDAGDGKDGGRGASGDPRSHPPTAPRDGGDGGDGGNGGGIHVHYSDPAALDYAGFELQGGDGGEGGQPGRGAPGWAYGELGRPGDGGSVLVEIESGARGSVYATAGHGGDDVAGAHPAGQGGSVRIVINAVSAGGGVDFWYLAGRAGGGGTSRSGGAPGAGGDASAEITGIATGDDDVRLGYSTNALRGWGGGSIASEGGADTAGKGGDAHSRTVGTALGDGDVTLVDSSVGGPGGWVHQGYQGSGGRGGDATSSAIGHGEGNGKVQVEARAVGSEGGVGRGNGRHGGAPGSASASARATSAGGGDASAKVTVMGGRGGWGHEGADGADGASVILVDAVSGSTAGRLELEQYAYGGYGGGGERNGNGGSAISSLTADNPGGGDLAIHSEAHGRGVGLGIGGRVGTATASAHGRGAGDASVEVKAHALAAAAFDRFDAGEARLGQVRGESAGAGDVRVTGIVTGGKGSDQGGKASGASIVDAVDGQTEGDLFLAQRAIAGDGGHGVKWDNGVEQSDGADALAALTRSVSAASFELQSFAYAGDAGFVGSLQGTRPPTGGTATAQGDAHNDAGSVKVLLRANGGYGWDSSWDWDHAGASGGDAYLDARGSTSGDGHDVVVGYGGSANGGRYGGNAISRSLGIAEGNSRVDVRDTAVGGFGHRAADRSLRSGGEGGGASSSAQGANAGNEEVFVRAYAQAGVGGDGDGVGQRGGAGGASSAEAWGGSSGGGNVFVEANVWSGSGGLGRNGAVGGTGGNSQLVDAVGGATAGVLTLVQTARAGDAGGGVNGQRSGEGGDARSILHAVNTGGGDLVARVEARAGSALAGYRGLGGNAGSALASVVAENDNASSIDVSAKVIGGGTREGAAGRAVLGEVSGTSTGGGDVSVSGSVEILTGRAPDGAAGTFDAQDGFLENAVSGATSGRLSLSQTLRAAGGSLDAATGIAGRSGDATSILSHTTSNRGLTLASTALGGGGQDGPVLLAADGGSALAESHAENLAGAARALALAAGGGAAVRGAEGSDALNDGADARVRATATTHGDGHDAVVGGLADESGAFGGGGARGFGLTGNIVAGQGGDASSESIGTALGNSQVDVYDRARGGNGGGGITRGDSRGGTGGDAVSHASGSNAGSESVNVTAHASGGTGGDAWEGVGGSGGGGEARASGFSTGGGDVHVTAIQEGGAGKGGRVAGHGAASTLNSAVAGSTSGTLSLEQIASGGQGGWSSEDGGAGLGGGASSTLFGVNPARGDLVLRSVAQGGAGGSANASQAESGRGADGQAKAVGVGTRETSVEAEATGGAGGAAKYGASLLGGGGAADADAVATTASRELATAYATARGGSVDVASSQPVPGGLGGAASARAAAIGWGEVASRATAIGGMSARAASGSPSLPGGAAIAQANAIGRSGSAAAEARSLGLPGESLSVNAMAPLARGMASAVSSTQVGAAPSRVSEGNAWAHGALRPDLDSGLLLLEGQQDVLAALSFDRSPQMLAAGHFGTERGVGLARDVLLHEIEIGLDVSILFDASRDDLVLGLFDPVLEKGIEWLDFRIYQAGTLLLEEHFGSGTSASDFFDDNVIDLDALIFGSSPPEGPALFDLDLEVAIDVALRRPRSGFGASFVAGLSTIFGPEPEVSAGSAAGTSLVLTPEPDTGLLMALGLLALAAKLHWARRRQPRGV